MKKLRWSIPTIIALMATLLAALLASPPPAGARAPDPVLDPIPDDPAPSGLGLVLKEVAQLPKSEPSAPPTDPRLIRYNRVNHVGEVPDGSGRLFAPDLNGKLYFLDKKDKKPKSYLDVGATFAPDFYSAAGLGQGFGFVAFHPEFKKNGKFYTTHVEAGDALKTKTPDLTPQPKTLYHGVIDEWTAKDPSASTFSGTHRELFRIGYAGRVHGLQQIDFNPNAKRGSADYGLLYVAAGDGGNGNVGDNGGDPQNLGVPQGKILRIDPAGHDSANGRYGVPRANPFAGQAGKVGEIYAYGMRDPHRFSWDTGGEKRLFLAHIGEHEIESIHEIKSGDNLGWSEREGPFTFSKDDRCHLYPLPADDAKYGYDYPVAAYDHDPPADWNCASDSGHAISGGYVYRGSKLPALRGKYLFTDIVDGRLLYTEERDMKRDPAGKNRAQIYQLAAYDTSGKPVTMKQLAGDDRVDLRYGSDGKGEPYLLAKANGKIWKVVGTKGYAGCKAGPAKVGNVMAAENWAPVTPSKWRFPGKEVVLAEAGEARPGPRRPFEYAVLKSGPEFTSTQIDAQVRLDTPVAESNRDVIVVFGYRDDTHYYYTHLSSDNTIYPHNGIFKVDGADRFRIDQQWNANRSHGAPPAIADEAWHGVRVSHCAGTGEISVRVDGAAKPVMTALDTTFGSGRVGFGSFDNIGRIRGLTVRGTPAS
ncbi:MULTISPECIES: PQQ-dependent sugar dehydrogenase [Thermomonosporaceae]|uniref:PQQ-dependent sugar dehydrogenase n=1 Tax=Thermomonosporaceae TaxID=2012 RepID=UPI00255A9707|nr:MULTISPECIES: PQQ-dependent sugar dehydrogenase [Thermomonosporaceae]MDL4775499.1 PQQ-dependent sugar dehydrogenase [Actinomadura xylanilytica]